MKAFGAVLPLAFMHMLLSLVIDVHSFSQFPLSVGGDINLIGSSFGIPTLDATFDYVVVGAGTAGLPLATRLAQNGSNSVAVVEAGGIYQIDNGNLSVVPPYMVYFTGTDPEDFNPLVDWGYATIPQAVSKKISLCYRVSMSRFVQAEQIACAPCTHF